MRSFIDVMPWGDKLEFTAAKHTRYVKITLAPDANSVCASEKMEVNAFGLSSNTADLLARIGAMTDAERGDVLRMLDAVKEEA